MPLVDPRVLVGEAYHRGRAVGYFESWNLESLQGVVDAAEAARSPVILGFNGEFLSAPERVCRERLAWYGALGRAAAETAAVSCALIFNECPRDGWVREAIDAGFNLVMPADPHAPYPEYERRVAELTRLAHARGVAVEAELAELPSGASGSVADSGARTDLEQAARFVAETGVDFLAVSVGNVHIMLRGEQELDLELLAAIRERVPVPLVLHGGTGIAPASLAAAIRLGVAKVNYGTYLKQGYLQAVRVALAREEANPHRLLGMGGPEDVGIAGRRAVREAVLERIGLLGAMDRG